MRKTKAEKIEKELNDIADCLCNRDVYGCVTPVIECIMSLYPEDPDLDLPFTKNDLNAAKKPRCPYCGSANITQDDDFDNEEGENLCNSRHKRFDYGDMPEVYEWWHVSDYLAYDLRKYGEIILEDGCSSYWGRCATGQSITLDGVIRQIAKERYDELHESDKEK